MRSLSSLCHPSRRQSRRLPRALLHLFVLAACVAGLARVSLADPCGMVPPIYVTDNTSIVRVGDQQTYVFYKDGIETFVIRPGFSGKVEDFGMLISFPTPPALRKVSEDIFPQIAKAIDPPEVVVDLRRRSDASGCSELRQRPAEQAKARQRPEAEEGRSPRAAARGRRHVRGGRARGRQRRRAQALDGRPRLQVSRRHGRRLRGVRQARLVLRGREGQGRRQGQRRSQAADEGRRYQAARRLGLRRPRAGDGLPLQDRQADPADAALGLQRRRAAQHRLSADRRAAEDSQHSRGIRRPAAHRRRPVPQRHPAAAAADHRRHRGRHSGLAAPEPAAAARSGAAQRLCQGAVRRRPAWR